jgi:hypothetical protein
MNPALRMKVAMGLRHLALIVSMTQSFFRCCC